jgi:hypothetical protein
MNINIATNATTMRANEYACNGYTAMLNTTIPEKAIENPTSIIATMWNFNGFNLILFITMSLKG